VVKAEDLVEPLEEVIDQDDDQTVSMIDSKENAHALLEQEEINSEEAEQEEDRL
jgi:hypothetical protein